MTPVITLGFFVAKNLNFNVKKREGNFMQTSFIWLDGAMVPSEQATVHVMSHTLHYGSGAFEGIRCYATDRGPAIFKLTDHVIRLFNSFACFGVDIPWSQQQMEQAIIDTVIINGFANCYIRPIIFFGSETLLLSPKNSTVHCAIIVIAMDKYLGDRAINVAVSPIKRIHPDALPVQNKINGFYVNSIFAFHEAKRRGFDEALLFDHDDMVAEGSVANIFFVIDGILVTPPTTSILPGITRASIMAIAQHLGTPVQEATVTLADISRATEAFFTGTASEITVIKSIEHKQFSLEGPITGQIKSAYKEAVMGNLHQFESWLTFINTRKV